MSLPFAQSHTPKEVGRIYWAVRKDHRQIPMPNPAWDICLPLNARHSMGDLASSPYLLSNLKVQTWQYLQPNTLARENCPMEDCSFTPIPCVVSAPQIPTGQHLLPNFKYLCQWRLAVWGLWLHSWPSLSPVILKFQPVSTCGHAPSTLASESCLFGDCAFTPGPPLVLLY